MPTETHVVAIYNNERLFQYREGTTTVCNKNYYETHKYIAREAC